MSAMDTMPENQVNMSEEELKKRRRRSVAIALVLVGMVVLFYAITIVRLGGNVASQAF